MSDSFFTFLRRTNTATANTTVARKRTEGRSFVSATPRRKKAQPQRPQVAQNRQPQKLNVDEYDILYIDSKIRDKIIAKMSSADDIRKDLEASLWILQNSENPIDQVMAKKQVSILRNRIKDFEGTFELCVYSLSVEPILREYHSIVNHSAVRSFVTSSKTNDSVQSKKSTLIVKYLRIAKDYIDVDLYSHKVTKTVCPSCGGIDFTSDDENSSYVCKGCGFLVEILDNTPTFRDTDRVNMCSRYTYSRRSHFIDAVKRFQGKQNTTIPQEVIDKMKEEMVAHSLTESTLTKDQLYMFLAENEFSKHYEDLNLLYYIIAKVPPPDIGEYETVLIDMFDKQEEAYNKVKNVERINSLNVNYKLYKLLQLVGYPCKKEDFYILKTKTKEDEHDEAWEEICKIVGWEMLPTI